MNVCQYCGKPATIHLTDIIHKKKKESHLCEACAREKQLIPESDGPQLNLNALIQLILGEHPSRESASLAADLACPHCGLHYGAFRSEGRFGCHHDYDIFIEGLMPLFERIHRSVRHMGKIPAHVRRQRELADLRRRLHEAVSSEQYEDAARLRDELRRKEGGTDGP